MIQLPPLTDELLNVLGEELGNRTFTGPNQRAFLSAVDSRDVQAAPGNGKTTLLVAKLVLLSKAWTSRKDGVCVISHTNAAREEIECKLANHPSASAFLSYPHFIGTVTTFIHQFIALPYLRGLGWSVERIDDELFEAVAIRARAGYAALNAYARNPNLHRPLERYVTGLELAIDFAALPEIRPDRLKVRHVPQQPRAGSGAGDALQELKAELVNDGIFRYGDMTTLARQALAKHPNLTERVRARFPIVLLDEAQDTSGDQLALLQNLFAEGVAFQRLGDQNQTLYETDGLGIADYWQAGPGVLSLNRSRRFGQEIATFASRLTARASQQIEGVPNMPSRRSLILFEQDSIEGVLPAYVSEVSSHWPDTTQGKEIWAVASRHNPPQGAQGNWRPKSLRDYYPNYRSGRGRNSRPETLCSALRQASVLHQARSSPAEIADLMTSAFVVLLRHQGVKDADGKLINKRTAWNVLAAIDPSLPLRLKRLMRNVVLTGDDIWRQAAWELFCQELKGILKIDQTAPAASSFLEFVPEGEIDAEVPKNEDNSTSITLDGILVKLGSIHSVKGKTTDAILVVETEIWRNGNRTMDLERVLPHAFELVETDFSVNPVHLSAATNIFVAVTRPREVLALALRKSATSPELLDAARVRGWNVVDLTLPTNNNDALEAC